MVNVAVINLRDIVKFMIKAGIIVIALVLIYSYFNSNKLKQTNISIDKSLFSFPTIKEADLLDSTFPSFLHNIDIGKKENKEFNLARNVVRL